MKAIRRLAIISGHLKGSYIEQRHFKLQSTSQKPLKSISFQSPNSKTNLETKRNHQTPITYRKMSSDHTQEPNAKRSKLELNNDYEKSVDEWRQQKEKDIRSPSGWLSVVGLDFLNPERQVYQIGSIPPSNEDEKKAFIVIPNTNSVPSILGKLHFNVKEDQIHFELTATDGEVEINGKRLHVGDKVLLLDDRGTQKATEVKVGKTVVFFMINRPPHGIAVRSKDSESEGLKSFKGRDWFPVDRNYIIDATFKDQPSEINLPDMLGGDKIHKSPGIAEFELEGKKISLTPVISGDKLEFYFRDKTSGKETYGACRFLVTPLPSNGKVVLDFNKAYNPPCAFTAFATCPMPPPQNRLKEVTIRAGEKLPIGYEHH